MCLVYSELFTTVLDMLATLVHSTLVSDAQSEKGEENRKHYQNLMKKLKKVQKLPNKYFCIMFFVENIKHS
jgi:lantibiotic modifying enzyme